MITGAAGEACSRYNVWISAFRFKGKPLELILKALEGEVEIFISQGIIDETLRVLPEKSGASDDELKRALEVTNGAATKVEPKVILDVVKDDPDDNKIVACAVSAGAQAIITADYDLLRMGVYDSIRMMRVEDLLSLQRER